MRINTRLVRAWLRFKFSKQAGGWEIDLEVERLKSVLLDRLAWHNWNWGTSQAVRRKRSVGSRGRFQTRFPTYQCRSQSPRSRPSSPESASLCVYNTRWYPRSHSRSPRCCSIYCLFGSLFAEHPRDPHSHS